MSSECYLPSGRVAWPRLILFTVVSLPVVVLLADAAFRLDRAHYYPPFLGAVVVGALAATLAAAVIDWGKCRNVALGRALAVVFALLFFFGFFQRALIDARTRGSPEGLKGVPTAELVTGLPNYVALRMRNFEVAAGPEQKPGAHQFMVVLRWIVFAMELVALAALGWWIGGAVAQRPFCERRGVWMAPKRFALPAGMGQGLVDWLEGGALPQRPNEGQFADLALLEYDPKDRGVDGYMTLAVGRGRARRLIARRRRVPAERLGELRAFFKA